MFFFYNQANLHGGGHEVGALAPEQPPHLLAVAGVQHVVPLLVLSDAGIGLLKTRVNKLDTLLWFKTMFGKIGFKFFA